MDSYYRLRRLSPLSASLPDVTAGQGGFMNEADFLFSPTKSVGADYNIDDDAWADKTDPKTGSVFHVQAAQTSSAYNVSSTYVLHSNSSSSLSSNPSMTELAPPSPTVPFQSLPERFTQSLQLSSPNTNEEDPIREYSNSTDLPPQKPRSIRKRIKKAVLRGGRGKSLNSSNQTASLSDLHGLYRELHTPVLPSFAETPTLSNVPQATLYGSRGIPLKSNSFHSSRSSVVKVHLIVKASSTDYVHAQCSLESLGIVPVRSLAKRKFGSLTSLKIKSISPSSPVSAQPVVIRGVVPGTIAAQTQQLQLGDTILRVNGHSVGLENIDAVLADVKNELSLVVRKSRFHDSTSPTHSLSSSSPSPGGFVRLVAGGRSAIKTHVDTVSHHLHMLLFLTLDTEEDDPAEKDILYKFPPSDDKKYDILLQLKGVFLTLSDVMGNITACSKSCSTIVLGYEVVHLSHIQYDKEVLLLALPGTVVSQYQVQLMIESIAETLQLLYGNVKRAFTNADNYPTLDHIFSLLFDKLFAEETSDSSLLGISAIAKLKLPTDIAVKLSVALSGLESADHNNRPEILHMRRPFTMLGSCLMYRGALACEHMPGSVLRNVVSFCNSYRLLEITASDSISQIVIWKEVHLAGLDIDFSPHQTRTFLLVVGLEHVLLCMIMEQTIHHHDSSVDAVYVDRGRTLILELKAHDVLAECETRGILSAPLPSLVSIDNTLYTSGTTMPKRKRLSDASRTRSLSKLEDGSDSDSPSHGGKVDSPQGSPHGGRQRSHSLLNFQLRTPKPRRMALQGHSISPASYLAAQTKPRTNRAMYSLTAGPSNILLQYIGLSPGMGVMVCPIHTKGLQPIQMEVIQCFRQACLSIREVLQGRANRDCIVPSDDSDSDEETDEQIRTDVTAAPFTSRRNPYFEHGVLFQCGAHSYTYWVVGRLFSEQRTELYVCYQENTSQDMIEMAFRLLFGWIA